MQQVIIAIHLMVVTALVILVLYQKSEGGALGMGGGSGVFTGRGQANALTRATGILATIFFITSIALTVLPAWERRSEGGDDWTKALDPGSIQIKELPKTEGKGGQAAPETAPEPGKDSIFEQLQRAQQKRQQSAPVEAPPAAARAAGRAGAGSGARQRPLRSLRPLRPPSPSRRLPKPPRRMLPSLKRLSLKRLLPQRRQPPKRRSLTPRRLTA